MAEIEDEALRAPRHPGIELQLRILKPNPNLPEPERAIAEAVYALASGVLDRVEGSNQELTEGLRELVRAKDSLIRASLLARGAL